MNYDDKALVYKMFQSVPKQKGTLDNTKPDMFLKNKYRISKIEKPETNLKGINMISSMSNCINFN